MTKANLTVNANFIVSELDRRVFGTFVEHMGRCVYGGIYEPGHETADENGFRMDVLELTKELAPTTVRYPGGNFLSGYNWQDGIGPKEDRPVKRDLAWGQTETNQFGTNEFMKWIGMADIEPMFAVNLGTAGPKEASEILEYCNHPSGTYWSDLRRSHGVEEPYNIKFWCLGNEMDGPWQICAKTAYEYGRIAKETAKVMRWGDDDLELAVCGSSFRDMPTYGAWEYEVLDQCFEEVDYISLHQYFDNNDQDIGKYLTSIDDLNSFITEVGAIADAVAAKRRSDKRIMLSLDEWNVWYKAHDGEDLRKPGWPEAPKILEEIYNFEDALVVGGAMITMMNNADRVKSACLAQLVNVIGPIMTETGGPAWRQTIFHPFAHCTKYATGNVLDVKIDCDGFEAGKHKAAPYLISTVLHDPKTDQLVVFALNRHQTETMDLSVALDGFGDRKLIESHELHHTDLKAINDKDNLTEVAPVPHGNVSVDGGAVSASLKPLSWNVFVTAPK